MEFWTDEEARDSFINMDCTQLAKLRSLPEVEYDLDYRCDICKKYWTTSKWFIMTHKAVEHGIPIPHNYKG